ncbi:catalase family protein [Providencia stuartii]|uniref:hypothetical protein n=1 Tax=Providencia stuartii TaxID=588 RepID=UPI002881F899|nr:hypothetical protein [Providencia stuartii]MDK7736173.1 hypothetical protein [Providencia stuartii]
MSKSNSKDHDINIQRNTGIEAENAAIEDIRRMFVDEIQVGRIVNENQTPARRAAFVKQHGVVHGTFKVLDNLPSKYQVGIFRPGASYPMWARYSSDIATNAPDLNSTVGIGIKLFDVPGGKVFGQGTTVDFILQNTQVFFAKDAEEMAEFKQAAMAGKLPEFLQTHPELAAVLDSMSKRVDSLLTEPLWSCVPFKFGENNYCKFKVDIEEVAGSTSVSYSAQNYLSLDLSRRLMNGQAILNFYVQIRNNPVTQSIISARSLWNESEAVPFKVATLTFPRQNINARNQEEYGESLAFNIWRTLPELEPVGSIAEARKIVYGSSSVVRRDVNGQSIGEPSKPRKANFSGYSVYQPTTETPWPVGELGNAIENFEQFPPITLNENHYITMNEVTISSRDVHQSVNINKLSSIGGHLTDKGISYINPGQSGTLRILFQEHRMKKVTFDLLVQPISYMGEDLFIQCHITNNENLDISEPTIVRKINGNINIEANNKQGFDLITLKFNSSILSFNINNIIMHFA